MDQARVLLFDIETSNLKADFGILLAIGWKWLGEKRVYCPQIQWGSGPFRSAEKRLLREFLAAYQSADVLVTYNGKRFDVPYLQAKTLEHGLGILPAISHVDLYYAIKHGLAISRKSLQNTAYYLKLSNEKSPVEGRIWMDAMTGSRPAMSYIVKHCKADVLVLEELYLKVRGLVRQHPRVGGAGDGKCRFCGSDRLQSRGTYFSKLKGPRRRIYCRNCDNSDNIPTPKSKMPPPLPAKPKPRTASARGRIREWEESHGARTV